jgi:hypothetical protein
MTATRAVVRDESARNAEYGRTDVGPMILLRSTQIVHFGSLSSDE